MNKNLDSKNAIQFFILWLDAIVECDDFPDPKRFNNAFLEWASVDRNSPFHLMFMAFVGAFDMVDYILEQEEER